METADKVGQIFQPNFVNFRPPRGLAAVAAGYLGETMISRNNGPLKDAEPVRALGLGRSFKVTVTIPDPNVPTSWRQQAAVLQYAADQSAAKLPILIGNDSVHGQNNLLNATIFPHHIGQGCLRDNGKPDVTLVRELASIAAKESYACGINWIFSPCVAVPHDLRWGRTYEGFSEDAEIVGVLGGAEVEGLQGSGVPMAACLKHFVADGGTSYGTGTWLFFWSGAPTSVCDHGDSLCDEATLREAHLKAYLPGLAAGCLTVMASYSSWRGLKMHQHRYLLTDVLKGELGFEGLVVSDYNAINHIHNAGGGKGRGNSTFEDTVADCLMSGIDMVMTAGGLIGLAGDLSYERQIECVYKSVGEW